MTTFSLFGVAYSISPGHTAVAGATFDWDAGAKTLAIAFNGQVPQGTASFAATFSAAVSGNSLTINGPPVSVQQAPAATFDLGVAWAVQSPKLNGRPDNLGVEFQDNAGTIVKALDKAAAPGWAQMPGSKLLSATLSFDAVGAIHQPLGDSVGTVMLTDKLAGKLGHTPLEINQLAFIDRIRTFHDHAEVTARPQSALLHLHADVLDTSTTDVTPSPLGTQESHGGPNDLLYQYALANGELLVVAEVSGAGSAAWQARADLSSAPALVLFRWQDEHGHPLAFCLTPRADNQPMRFNLGQRVGVSRAVGDSTSSGDWSQTNSAVVVIANSDGSAISGAIQALDAVTLYPRYIRSNRLADPFGDPDFVVNGVAPLSGKAPREIHGVADGAWLRLPDGATTPIPAELSVTAINSASISSIFHQSDLIILGAPGASGAITGWSLEALATEKQFHPDSLDGPAPNSQRVARRSVPANATAPKLRLPAIDTAFALCNLAGINRESTKGTILGDGLISKAGLDWHQALDEQFSGPSPTCFEIATLDTQTHASGFRVVPPQEQPFQGVLALPAISAASTTDTARTVPSLKQSNAAALPLNTVGAEPAAAAPSRAFSATYLFGGDPGNGTAVKDAQTETDAAAANFGPLFTKFRDAWSTPVDASPTGQAIQGLKEALGEAWRQATPPADLSGILDEAITLAAPDAATDGLSDEDTEGLNNQLTTMFPEDLGGLWADPGDDWIAGLLERAFSPPTLTLMRRAYTAIWPALMTFNAATVKPPPPPDQIKGSLDILQGLLPLDAGEAQQMLALFEKGLSLDIQQGIDALYSELVDLWATEDDPLGILDSLRARYGSQLTPDVYQNILRSANDAAQLLQAAKELLSVPLASLADIKTEPPEYLFVTKRFPVTGAVPDDGIEALWSAHQPLCRPQDAVDWTFFLDDTTCVIVKLKPGRSVSAIIMEVEANYKSADRPDPLGFGSPDERQKFFQAIDAEVNAPDWLGVLLIEPWIDLSRDTVLRDLAGFDHIDGRYIAVGGRRPAGTDPNGADNPPPVQVWAWIYKEAPGGDPTQFNLDPSPTGDVKFSLVKFDVAIAKSAIVTADIVFRLDIGDLLGKQAGQKDQNGNTIEFETINLKGALSRPSANGDQQLTFGAWFDTPYKAVLDFAFLDTLELHSITATSRNGTTCLEIDGILDLQNPKTSLGFDINLFDSGGTGGHVSLTMHDFRILLPSLPAGMAMPFGQFRNLGFDFPDLGFQLPHPRAFNVFGVEFIPTGLGYVHGDADAARAALNAAYSWFDKINFGTGISIPYMEFDVDFGKLPQFGDNDVRGLRLRLAIAFHFTNLSNIQASIGISGLDATDIKIDFFRLLTLTMDTLAIGPGYSGVPLGSQPTGAKNTGIIAALNADLRILGWSPTGGPLSIVLAHPMADPKQPITPPLTGAAIWAVPDPSSDDSFFELHWLLLAHNITLDSKLKSYLLEADFADSTPSSFPKLVEVSGATNGQLAAPVLHAQLTNQESWVFGISFQLGEILDKCTILLDDHHYYGIRLYADWLELVFGVDVLELAYIAADSAAQDRFRVSFHVPAFEVLGLMRSGELALEWNPNWDWLIDVGFPWRVGDGYQWERAFEVPFGCYEASFGFYFEKQSVALPTGDGLELSAGMGFYLAYAFSAGSSVAWVSAGIGVFAIVQGTVVFEIQSPIKDPFAIFKSSIYSLTITGVIGIYAYGEGGIDIWIISARFRVSVQAAIACTIGYTRGAPCSLAYDATFEAQYYASVQVGCGLFSWTFTVSGAVGMDVNGHTMLA